jgi:hypothetical protein
VAAVGAGAGAAAGAGVGVGEGKSDTFLRRITRTPTCDVSSGEGALGRGVTMWNEKPGPKLNPPKTTLLLFPVSVEKPSGRQETAAPQPCTGSCCADIRGAKAIREMRPKAKRPARTKLVTVLPEVLIPASRPKHNAALRKARGAKTVPGHRATARVRELTAK